MALETTCMAMGADAERILRMVLWQGLMLGVAGDGIGVDAQVWLAGQVAGVELWPIFVAIALGMLAN